jgi:branched-subunit amino acid transport protein
VPHIKLWLIIVGIGLLTYASRLAFIVLLGRVEVPVVVRHALRFVPPAVLSAIIIVALSRPSGGLDLAFGKARLLAAALAVFVAWRTKNALLTIGLGMLALWILRTLMS